MPKVWGANGKSCQGAGSKLDNAKSAGSKWDNAKSAGSKWYNAKNVESKWKVIPKLWAVNGEVTK